MKHFDISEFDSPDKKGSGKNMQQSTLDKLDKARGIADVPFKINSGYRTRQRNKKVGGKSNSSHLKGYAIDVSCKNSLNRFKIVNALLEVGFNRIGIGDTFIHADDDPEKTPNVIWIY